MDLGWILPFVRDSSRIFFSWVLAQFLCSCFRKVVGGVWCHTDFPDLSMELCAYPTLAWTLWKNCKKLVIEHSPLQRPIDVIFKMCGFLQPWKPLRVFVACPTMFPLMVLLQDLGLYTHPLGHLQSWTKCAFLLLHTSFFIHGLVEQCP